MSLSTFTVIKLEDFGNMTKFLLNAARGGLNTRLMLGKMGSQ